MIKLFLLVVAFASTSLVHARNLDEKIREENCHIKASKDMIFPYGKGTIRVGSLHIAAKAIDQRNNRRLAPGRILKIKSLSEKNIQFDDASISAACFLNMAGDCAELFMVDAEKFEGMTGNHLTLVCNARPTIDF